MLPEQQSKTTQTLMAQSNRKIRFGLGGTPSSPRRSEMGYSAVVVDLVHQAAELFGEIEEQARGAETRAESLLRRLHFAEARIEEAEQARRETFAEADSKLEAASRALDRAERELIAAQDKVTAAEVRAELADIKAHEALEALALAEQLIRKQLLSRAVTTECAAISTEPNSAAVPLKAAPAALSGEA